MYYSTFLKSQAHTFQAFQSGSLCIPDVVAYDATLTKILLKNTNKIYTLGNNKTKRHDFHYATLLSDCKELWLNYRISI